MAFLLATIPHMLNSQILQRFIEQHQLLQRPLYVALSGGSDSVCLLAMFNQLRAESAISFSAIHVNHGLSENAMSWQQQNEALCEKLNVPLISKQVNIEKLPRTSLEQLARDARYQTIASELPDNAVLFTGHHQVDQFETVILRLMRGAGLKGLGAMKAISSFPNKLGRQKGIQLVRPLLSVDKAEVLNYLEQQKLSWVEDESNQDQQYDRNFVRHTLLPAFKQRWSKAESNVATSAELLQQDSKLLTEYLLQDLVKLTELGFANQHVLNIEKLLDFSDVKQAALLRTFIWQQTAVYPSRSALQQIKDNILMLNSDNKGQVQCGNYSARNFRAKLYLVPNTTGAVLTMRNSSDEFEFANNPLYSSLQLTGDSTNNVEVRFGELQHKFKYNEKSGSKTISKWLKEQGCPSWYRKYTPLLFIDNECIGIADSVSELYQNKIHVKLVDL